MAEEFTTNQQSSQREGTVALAEPQTSSSEANPLNEANTSSPQGTYGEDPRVRAVRELFAGLTPLPEHAQEPLDRTVSPQDSEAHLRAMATEKAQEQANMAREQQRKQEENKYNPSLHQVSASVAESILGKDENDLRKKLITDLITDEEKILGEGLLKELHSEQEKSEGTRDKQKITAMQDRLGNLLEKGFLTKAKTKLAEKEGYAEIMKDGDEKLFQEILLEKIAERRGEENQKHPLTEEEFDAFTSEALRDYQIMRLAESMQGENPEVRDLLGQVQAELIKHREANAANFGQIGKDIIQYLHDPEKDKRKKVNLLKAIAEILGVLVADEVMKIIEMDPSVIGG